MSNIEFNIPIIDANFSFAIRNDGEPWPSLQPLTEGVARPSRTVSFGQCDEILIEANFANFYDITMVHLSGLSLKGLHFSILDGNDEQLLADDQKLELFPRAKIRQTLDFSSKSTDTIKVIIHGVAQRFLDFEQIVFCAHPIKPDTHFDGGSPFRIGATFTNLNSQTHSSQKFNSKLRAMNAPFLKLSKNDAALLDYSITEIMQNGFCFVRLGDNRTSGEYNFLAFISIAGGNATQVVHEYKNMTINIIEAYEQ